MVKPDEKAPDALNRPAAAVLDLRVGEMRQLFNAMDPAPFRERDLDPNAQDFIVSWGREIPRDQPLGLVVHVSRETISRDSAVMLRDAVQSYFRDRAGASRQQLGLLFRNGRISLVIGLAFLVCAVVIGGFVSGLVDHYAYGWVVKESFMIGGWVALWRPLEIFLYDWWPIWAEARLYDRLGAMSVEVSGLEPAEASRA